jgi:P-type Ca2+ transporter type 2C
MSEASEKADPSRAFHQPIDDVVAALGTNVQHGLSDGEAQSRLRQHGRNELLAEQPLPGWRRFLAQFQNVLVILLLVATTISAGLWIYERDAALPYEAIAIFAVVLLNAAMGYIQESRAAGRGGGSSRNVSCRCDRHS